MNTQDFIDAIEERAKADAQDKKTEEQTQAISDAITAALKPFTDNPPKIQRVVQKFDKLPTISATVDHTPVVEAINNLSNKPQPTIRVVPPQVHVDVPPLDLSPLKKVLKQPKDTQGIVLSTYRAQDIDEMEQGIQYVGFLNPKGEWYIIRNEEAANKLRYKFGTQGYQEAFAMADKFEYKLLNEAINEVQA
jgi:hypothetical protein